MGAHGHLQRAKNWDFRVIWNPDFCAKSTFFACCPFIGIWRKNQDFRRSEIPIFWSESGHLLKWKIKVKGNLISLAYPSAEMFFMSSSKDSSINLDQNLSKVTKIFGQVESTVQVEITQEWIKILFHHLYLWISVLRFFHVSSNGLMFSIYSRTGSNWMTYHQCGFFSCLFKWPDGEHL